MARYLARLAKISNFEVMSFVTEHCANNANLKTLVVNLFVAVKANIKWLLELLV